MPDLEIPWSELNQRHGDRPIGYTLDLAVAWTYIKQMKICIHREGVIESRGSVISLLNAYIHPEARGLSWIQKPLTPRQQLQRKE